MSATGVMTGARLSYDAAMTAARGAATSTGKTTYVVRDTGQGRNPVSYHYTDAKPYGGRYTLIQEFNPAKPPPDGQAPWYMGDKAPGPVTRKSIGLMEAEAEDREAEATVKAVHDIRDMVETLVEELVKLRERQSLVDVSAMIDSLEASLCDAYEATYGVLPEDDE